MGNTLKLVLVAVIGFALLLWNPLGFTGAYGVLYFLVPGIVYVLFLDDNNKWLKAQGLTDTQIDFINKEKWKSFLRSAIQIVGAVITFSAMLGLKIPFIDPISNSLKELSGQFDLIIDSIVALVGVVITIIGFFKNSARFEQRALINPKKINL